MIRIKKKRTIAGKTITKKTTFLRGGGTKTVITATGDKLKTVIRKTRTGKTTRQFFKGRKLLRTTKK